MEQPHTPQRPCDIYSHWEHISRASLLIPESLRTFGILEPCLRVHEAPAGSALPCDREHITVKASIEPVLIDIRRYLVVWLDEIPRMNVHDYHLNIGQVEFRK